MCIFIRFRFFDKGNTLFSYIFCNYLKLFDNGTKGTSVVVVVLKNLGNYVSLRKHAGQFHRLFKNSKSQS